MRIAAGTAAPKTLLGETPPLWPPILASRGSGSNSSEHAHHAMHLIVACEGTLSVRMPSSREPLIVPGIVTAPDVPHAIDSHDREVLLVFVDPESDVGTSLRGLISGPFRSLNEHERDAFVRGADPRMIMGTDASAWLHGVLKALGARLPEARKPVHPRVRRAIQSLRNQDIDSDDSLAALATKVGLSQGRLMHAFTESIGIPIRPYVAWLRVQRAASAIVTGANLSDAAIQAGFADAAHMSRTFRRMFGMSPSTLRSQPVRSRPITQRDR